MGDHAPRPATTSASPPFDAACMSVARCYCLPLPIAMPWSLLYPTSLVPCFPFPLSLSPFPLSLFPCFALLPRGPPSLRWSGSACVRASFGFEPVGAKILTLARSSVSFVRYRRSSPESEHPRSPRRRAVSLVSAISQLSSSLSSLFLTHTHTQERRNTRE